VVLEADTQVGGISKTVEIDGWRFDIGGHRFFTKVDRVESFWHRILPAGSFLMRPRMSRIFYNGKFFDYPLKALNALRGLGVLEAIRCMASYFMTRLRPPKDQTTFEGWVAARFGWRLYRIFFKTYTEKVWGVPATAIQSDWAAQRIKNLSLVSAVTAAVLPRRNGKQITSLIEQFQYPKYGPGMMWESCADSIRADGVRVEMGTRVSRIEASKSGVSVFSSGDYEWIGTDLISSMPISELIQVLEPAPPAKVQDAANDLKYRDFLTVALVVPLEYSFPDNWIYIHSPHVRVGRVQNYGSWSPYLIKEGRTCLGLEYFVSEGDDLWTADDELLISLAANELATLGLVDQTVVESGYVVRMPKAYPVYDQGYEDNVNTIRRYLEDTHPNIHPVGRNGMHRYNNQDHSMLTAMLTAENIALGTQHDVWSVNVEDDYHEESYTSGSKGSGRAAPIVSK